MGSRHALDPRLVKIVALWRGSEHEGERQAAKQRVECLAATAGLSFEQAIEAAEAAERRVGAVQRYGSEAAALAPCLREQKLRKAVEPWTVSTYGRWTLSVDRRSRSDARVSARVRRAIAEAYPLPQTIEQIIEECGYWKRRDEELAVLRGDGSGLGPVATIRLDILRNMMLRQIDQSVMKRFADRIDRDRALHCIQRELTAARAARRQLSAREIAHIGTALGHLLVERPDLAAGEMGRLRQPGGFDEVPLPDGFHIYDLACFEVILAGLFEQDRTEGSEQPATVPLFVVSDRTPKSIAA